MTSRILFVLSLLVVSRGFAQDSKTIPVTYRDFNASHKDFEGANCIGGPGMVQDTLGPDRKPVHLPANVCGDNSLHDWFHDSPDNARYCRDLTFTKKSGTSSTFEHIDQTFFPIDDVATSELSLADDGLQHNMHFCMEMHASFKYEGGEVFDFLGDDDVWVYINNRLALDLGGVHASQEGTVNLDAQKAKLGLVLGNHYDFDFFFCERQTRGSHMKVTTTIDLRPPPSGGLHIADAKLNILTTGDTVGIGKGAAPLTFNGVKIDFKSQTVDCSDLLTQTKTSLPGNWKVGDKALPPGVSLVLDPASLAPGIHKLVFEKDGKEDFLWIQVSAQPIAAQPVANPSGTSFVGNLLVGLSSATPGAAIHYTVDGSTPTASSPLYTTPIVLTSASTIRAIAIAAGFENSTVMAEVYSKLLSKAIKGYYQDRNGDGRIETAVLLFDSTFRAAPTTVSFSDPFNKQSVSAPLGAVVGNRQVTFNLNPFAAGTGFPAEELGRIAAEADAFAAQGISMEDSVGPVLKGSKSIPSGIPGAPATFEVEFTEAVVLDVSSLLFPFDLKRGGIGVPAAEIKVEKVVRITPSKYRITFVAGSKYPVPMDSVRIASQSGITDMLGNRSLMSIFVPVTGDPTRASAELDLGLQNGVTVDVMLPTLPNPNPVVVTGVKTCANCGSIGLKDLLPSHDPAVISTMGPTWNVKTKFPFSYSLKFFNTTGEFVNQAEGDLSASQFEILKAEGIPGDSVAVRLTFLPLTQNGNSIATGAYIMKGILKIREQPGLKGPQGESVTVAPVEHSILSRFGFIRKSR